MKTDKLRLLKILICLGLSLYLILLPIRGNLENYLHPRMFPYVYLAAAMLLLLALSQIGRIRNSSEMGRTIPGSLILFILPLILGALPESSSLQGDLSATRGIIISDGITLFRGSGDKAPLGGSAEAGPVVPGGALRPDLIVDESNFLVEMYAMYRAPREYEGMRITLSGFAMTLPELEKDQMVLSRMAVSCCAADASVIGLICRHPRSSILFKEESWYAVEGVISRMVWNGRELPVLVIDSWEEIGEPENKFVY